MIKIISITIFLVLSLLYHVSASDEIHWSPDRRPPLTPPPLPNEVPHHDHDHNRVHHHDDDDYNDHNLGHHHDDDYNDHNLGHHHDDDYYNDHDYYHDHHHSHDHHETAPDPPHPAKSHKHHHHHKSHGGSTNPSRESGPGIDPDVRRCLSNGGEVVQCVEEITRSFITLRPVLGRDCCRAIRDIDQDCQNTIFGAFSNPFFDITLQLYCSMM